MTLVSNSSTLKSGRLRGDVIEVNNITPGIHNSSSNQFNMFIISITRGNEFKMKLTHIHYEIWKHSFSDRIFAVWNSPPNVVVVDLTYIFENRVEKFWTNHHLRVNWSAKITGIGSRTLSIACKYLRTYFSNMFKHHWTRSPTYAMHT
jgi:hypothetical protein